MALSDAISRILEHLERMLGDDIATNIRIGDNGADVILQNIPEDDVVNVMTYCNTGSLATAGSSQKLRNFPP